MPMKTKRSALKRDSLRVSLLTGGDDPNYAIPLLTAIVEQNIPVEFIGNDEMEAFQVTKHHLVSYLNLRGNQDQNAPLEKKVSRILSYYSRLIRYSFKTESKLFHILWLNKFTHFDRSLLNLFYKMTGKKIVFTAHNINEKARDGKDNLLNRMTLKVMYRLVDHIIVHTKKMKSELVNAFDVEPKKITVMNFGLNDFIRDSALTCIEAREKVGLGRSRLLLFFGQIAPYKGLEYLINALAEVKEKDENVRLIIAGKVKRGYETYWRQIEELIIALQLDPFISKRIEHIPDDDVEVYFKAADVLIQPYKEIFQSGPLFMAYKFGLPVIATDVGSFRDDIIDGKTGFVCKPKDPQDLANKILLFFESELYKELPSKREEIAKFAMETYSWKNNALVLKELYRRMLFEN